MKRLLQDGLTDQAEKRPDAVAIVLGDQRFTYGQLERLSNRLARALKAAGCRRGDRVCLFLPKSPMAVAAILGTLKADCMYVPMDVSSPPARTAKLFEKCQSDFALAGGPVLGLLDQVRHSNGGQRIRIGWLDDGFPQANNLQTEFSLSDLTGESDAPLDYQNTPEDPAYILFTSGSTGIPKGVLITHSNAGHFIRWGVTHFGLGPQDRISGHTPLYFDLSVFDLFGTFEAGGQLFFIPPELNLFPKKLAEFIRTAGMTQWFSVPSILHYMAQFDVIRQNDFPDLRRLLWCGEVFATHSLIYWMNRLPHVQFTNLYGPTEATVASSYYTVPECPKDPKAQVPIGVPCGGERLRVLDEHLRPLPPGQVGDLYIGGVGVSPGYWKDPEKTREVFIPDAFSENPDERLYKTGDLASIGPDGLFYFHGRSDDQVKSRGFRIELGEIEAALNGMGMLRECAVVGIKTNGFEGTEICCAYVPQASLKSSVSQLRKALARLLPGYMIPSQWMTLSEMPKNINGKIDRKALKEKFSKRESVAHP